MSWEQKPLLECVDLLQGLTYCPDNVKSYGILVLRSSNVKNSKIDFEDCVFVNCSVDEDKYVQPNDILICVRNGSSALIGKSCVIDKPYNATFGAFMSILRGDKTGYVAHVFASDIVQSQIRNRSSATINQITKRDFEDIVIPIPAEETEQRRIAEALSDTDALLAAMGKLIAKKRAIKQGAMQELLTGKRRLPGFEREWVERTVDYYGTFTSGNGFPLVYQGEKAGDYPFYKVSDFSNAGNENIMRRANHYISWAIATMLNCNIIPDGSIVFAKIGAAIFLERKRQNQGDCCIDNNMMAFTANDEGDSKYIMYLFQTIKFGDLVTATALPSLSGKQVGAILKQFPPTEAEQTAIAEILSDMDAEIDALTAKLNKLRNIKQGMMSELLTGRIRLTEQEAETSPEAKHKVKIIKLPAAKKIAAKKQIKSTAVKKTAADAKEAYRDAVIMVALVNAFGTEEHPFTAFDCQKFPYLFHRHVEGAAKGYTKQAAGPYNADLKYRTARPIALKKNYVREHVGNYKGFVVSDDAQEALDYFAQWHGEEPLKWLEQFRRIKDRRDELELLTTVDMAMVELREAGNPISLLTVKKIIQSSKAWRAKLKREIFSDANIIRAIRWSNDLFGTEGPPQ